MILHPDIEAALKGDDEASAEQRWAAAGFLCWPMNCIDLAKKDEDLPKLVSELAGFIARRESNVASAERKRCAEIVQATRFGEVDKDFRSIVSMIESGETVEQLAARDAYQP